MRELKIAPAEVEVSAAQGLRLELVEEWKKQTSAVSTDDSTEKED